MDELLPDELLKTKLLRNGFWLYLFAFIGAPTGYIIKMLIAQSLSLGEIWIFYSILGIIALLSAYNDLGLTEALQYYLPHYIIDKKNQKAKSIIIYTILLQFISGIIVWWSLYFWAERLNTRYFKNENAVKILQIFSLYFIIFNIHQVLNSLFISIQKVKRYQWTDAIRMWTIVILTYIGVMTDTISLTSFAFYRIIGVLVAVVIGYIGIHKYYKYILYKTKLIWDKILFNQQRKYGIRVMLGAGATTLLWQINQQYALYYLWAEAAGYRAYYLSFYSIISIIVWPLISYLFPLLNELYKKGEIGKIKYLYKILFVWVLLFGIIGWVVGYYWSERLAVLLYGENFLYSGTLFRYYAPFLVTIPLIGIFFQDIASRWLVRERVMVIVWAFIANILASFAFGASYWLQGLVYAQLVGNIILIIGGWWYYNKK